MRSIFLRLMVVQSTLFISSAVSALPKDVPSHSWASHAVEVALSNGILTTDSHGRFDGKAEVTVAEVANSLEKLSKRIIAKRWVDSSSSPLPKGSNTILEHGDWEHKRVNRYMLAAVLVRMGDYCEHGILRAPNGAKDTDKSTALPSVPVITMAKSNPAYSAVHYLALHHMLWKDSPLLSANTTINGKVLSTVLAQMVVGLNNMLTSLGHDAENDTPDASFHARSKK